MNLPSLSERFKAAVEAAELALARLRVDRRNERLILRSVRSLRRCHRLREDLKTMVENGTL